jgi:hypothetical protein
MELRSFHVISQPKGRSGKDRTGDIVLHEEDHLPRHVEVGPGGGAEGGERRSHENGCTPWGERNCSGQARSSWLTPWSVTRIGEDVEDP